MYTVYTVYTVYKESKGRSTVFSQMRILVWCVLDVCRPIGGQTFCNNADSLLLRRNKNGKEIPH